MKRARGELTLMEMRLETGQELRLVSGRVLSIEEIGLRVQEQTQRIELAQHKIAMLNEVLTRRQERKQLLDEKGRQAPFRLGQLELSYRHLAGSSGGIGSVTNRTRSR